MIRQNRWQALSCLSQTKNADFHKSYFFEARGFTSAGFLFISPADFGKTVISLVKRLEIDIYLVKQLFRYKNDYKSASA